jgi:hypothetical protein
MTNKKGRYFLLIAIFTLLWNQQTNYLAQKIAIENSYRDKVNSAVSRILGQEKFLVIVNVEFSTMGGTLKKGGTTGEPKGNTYTPVPGIPTFPSSKGKSGTSTTGSKTLSANDYNIGRVEVTVGIDETIVTGSVKQEIKQVVARVIPETADCEDCIKIEAMEFQKSKKDKKIDELVEKIEKLESAKRKADISADSIRLIDLTKQLDEANTIKQTWEAMAKARELQQMKQDSIRFENLVRAERKRKVQDSIKFVNTEDRLERVIESKIKSDSTIIRETMDILRQTTGTGEEKEKSILGMDIGGGGSGIMSSVIFILLIVALMIVTFLAANNKKPKTVYLKPKGKDKEPKKKDKKEKKESKEKDKKSKNGSDETPTEEAQTTQPSPEAAPPPPRPDEDALRSEIKSLRQTAVSLTVGEKEGASALIKEWLSDNPNKSDEGSEEEGEE